MECIWYYQGWNQYIPSQQPYFMSLLQLKGSQLLPIFFTLCDLLYQLPVVHYYVLLCHVIGQQNTLVFVKIVYLYITNQHSPTHLKTSWEWPNNGRELAYPTPQNKVHCLNVHLDMCPLWDLFHRPIKDGRNKRIGNRKACLSHWN